jgi:anti-anti-sigma regulatory factor
MTVDAVARYENEGDWLVVTVTGNCDADWVGALAETIADAARAASSKAVLLDVRAATGFLSLMDRFFIGETHARVRAFVPLAVVGVEPLVEPGHFGALVARNRGAVVQIFGDIADARTWLAQRTAGPPTP